MSLFRRIRDAYDDVMEVTATFWMLFSVLFICIFGILLIPYLLWRQIQVRRTKWL